MMRRERREVKREKANEQTFVVYFVQLNIYRLNKTDILIEHDQLTKRKRDRERESEEECRYIYKYEEEEH